MNTVAKGLVGLALMTKGLMDFKKLSDKKMKRIMDQRVREINEQMITAKPIIKTHDGRTWDSETKTFRYM
ncbi:hypothetical protein ACQKJG_18245 [Priestia megaterium]|uniref:hypothetical protein n=1 Tax=Priestia megaterium TaxID=1404 RepID=UPI003D08B9B6